MTVANLGIAVTSNADKAAIDLDRLTAASARAEAGARKVSQAAAMSVRPIIQDAPVAARALQGTAFQTANVAAQLNDIGVMLASGQSPFIMAIQQGTQLNQVLGGMGARGAIGAVGAAFTSLINPVSLATIGIIAFGGVAVQALAGLLPAAESASDAIDRHGEEIQALVRGYKSAEDAAKDYVEMAARLPAGAAASDLQKKFSDLNKEAEAFAKHSREFGGTLSASFGSVEQQVGGLLQSFGEGQRSAADLVTQLTILGNSDLGPLGFILRGQLIDPLIEAAQKARLVEDALVSLSHVAAGLGESTDLRFALDNRVEGERSAEAHRIEMDAINAKTPAQMADIARRREALALADEQITEALRQQKIEQAGAEAYARAQAQMGAASSRAAEQQRNAHEALIASIDERVAKSEMEAKALLLGEDAAARLRIEFELLSQARSAGTTLDPAYLQQSVDRLAEGEKKIREQNKALADQKRLMDQLAGSAQSIAGSLMGATGLSNTPLGSAINGGLGSLLKGDFIGAAIGGITGLITGFIEQEQRRQQAIKAANDNKPNINAFIAQGFGQDVNEISVAVAQFRKQAEQYIELARAAGDQALVRRLQATAAAYRDTLRSQERIERLQSKVDASRDTLREAYERESAALRDVIDRTKAFVDGIRSFKQSLLLDSNLSPLSPQDRLVQAQMDFQRTSTAALGGDAAAQARLQDAATSYLEQAREFYASSGAYASIFDQVQSVLDRAIAAGTAQISDAERQLNVMTQQVSRLIDINTSVVSVADAIKKLNADTAKLLAAQIKLAEEAAKAAKQQQRENSQNSGRRAA